MTAIVNEPVSGYRLLLRPGDAPNGEVMPELGTSLIHKRREIRTAVTSSPITLGAFRKKARRSNEVTLSDLEYTMRGTVVPKFAF